MNDAYAKSVAEVLEAFRVDPTKGLSDSQVEENARLYGKNVLPEEESTPFWKRVLKQFDDLLVKILIAAAIISFLLALVNGETGLTAFLEPSVILMILAANAAVGVITETNAEKALEELRAYQADVATVLRNGCFSILPATELVPGDIVEVGVGCKVPADMRMIEMLSNQLRVDQAILTGESSSVAKELGSTFAPEGMIFDTDGIQLEFPAQFPCLLHIAMCSALCNESTLQYNPDKRTYEKIGESTEVALRVLVEKVGLPGFDSMPSALTMLSKHERASYCNRYWEHQFKKIFVLDFSRDRKMIELDDLCNHVEMGVTDIQIDNLGPGSRSTSVIEKINGTCEVALCVILDEPLLRQLEVHCLIPSLSVHFSEAIHRTFIRLLDMLETKWQAITEDDSCFSDGTKKSKFHQSLSSYVIGQLPSRVSDDGTERLADL